MQKQKISHYPQSSAGNIVTTKKADGTVLLIGTQTIKFSTGLVAGIVGGEVVVTAGAAALSGDAFQVLSFDSLGTLITTGSHLRLENTIDRIYSSLPTNTFVGAAAGVESFIWGNSTYIENVYNSIVVGYSNSIGAAALPIRYSAVFGASHITYACDGILLSGLNHDVHESTQVEVHGRQNNVSTSLYSHISGHTNVVKKAEYSLIHGLGNIVGDGTNSIVASSIFGQTNNVINSVLSLVHGVFNALTDCSSSLVQGQSNAMNNMVSGFIFGNSNIMNPGVTTYCSFISGKDNTMTKNYAAVFGQGLTAGVDHSFSCGLYNVGLNLSVFEVGVGTSAVAKYTALDVNKYDGATRSIKDVNPYSVQNIANNFVVTTASKTDHTFKVLTNLTGALVTSYGSGPSIDMPLHDGQRLTILITGDGNPVTFRYNMATRFAGGVDAVLHYNDIIELISYNSVWYETNRSHNHV